MAIGQLSVVPPLMQSVFLEDLEQKGVTSKLKNNKTLSSHYSNGKSMILKHTAADRLICFPT